ARPVECSAELTETTAIDTPPVGSKPARLAVSLMNFSGRPVTQLSVRISGLASVKSIRSVQRGSLRSDIIDGDVIVTLPLDIADMLLIDR
ncbi:MAG: hypothetical protein ABGX07_12125, partial [Pirellulaceae bacterium]